tara:strand:+ start:1741 stop:1977 length:237 start_codon:yes stop_codon:yes gene_type:complete
MSQQELMFHSDMSAIGCPTFVVVQSHTPGTTRIEAAELLLYRGAAAEDLYYRGVELEPLDRWPLGAVQWEIFRWKLVE